jgi:two-component system alkaline phosphatase synthesis response regulator PhoP
MKVLIIEDEEALRKVLQEKMEHSGFETFAAKDGDEGWDMAKSKNPDIILLDLVLPKRSGFDLLSMLKQDPELKNIPIFILSNLAEDESLKKALQMGAEDYFVKAQHPINEIVEKVKNRLLEKSR